MSRSLRGIAPLAILTLAGASAPLLAQAPKGKAPSKAAAAAAPMAPVPVATEFDKLHFRSIGPATMSGRISDFAVYEANPAIYYVGTAHGGVWKTTNNGATYTPIFQDQGLIAIGDVAVSQTNPDLLWVGAGESNNRQSTSWGGGIWKSTDGGKTFALMGLPESKHINRIVIHPTNNEVVLVAATGPLFGPGGERGVYKTTDGGKTWKAVLKVDDETGANDLVMSAQDPNVLYASTYQRRRTACCMNGGGPGSALWKSTDGGETWSKITGTGFPTGSLGRIAVDVFRKDQNIVYAQVEAPTPVVAGRGANAAAEGAEAPEAPAGGRGGAGANTGATGTYRSTDGGATWTKMSATNARPMYFSQIRIDANNSDRLYAGGVGLHLSVDGGKTFETDAALVIHDDIHAIWVDPKNGDHVLIGGDGGVAMSYDMAKTWQAHLTIPVGLFYHVGYDMEYPFNVCGGMQDNYDWCGPSASRHSRGIYNYDWFQILGGDGFVAIPDQFDSRIVYTESQDGNMIRRNKVTGESRSIRPTPQNVVNATRGETYRFHWDTPLLLSGADAHVLLAAGNRVFRSRDRGDSWEAISPDLTKNEIRDSIVTMGLKGKDITIAKNDGIAAWPTIVSLAESPKQAGVFYTGTDDGTVSMSKDNGKTWTNITKNLPGFPAGHVFVSEVVPSRFDAGTVYITVDNHRLNDYQSYIWVSKNYGQTFTKLTNNLHDEVVKTLTEDTKNPDVLYIGTETGIFLSIDRGTTWKRLKANFPTVRVDELTIHPRDNALIVASHGRAIWILDHLEPIQEYAAAQAADAKLFTPGPALQWKSKDDRNEEFWGHQFWTGENPPTEAVIQLHFKKAVGNPSLRITDANGALVRELPVPAAKNAPGLQTVCWDQRVEPIKDANAPAGPPAGGGRGAGGPGGFQPRVVIPGYPENLPPVGYQAENPCGGAGGFGGFGRGGGGGPQGPQVLPGTYNVALVADGKTVETKKLTIVMDPQVTLTVAERAAWNAKAMELHTAQQQGTDLAAKLNALNTALRAAKAKLDSTPSASADVKAQFDAFQKEWDAFRPKLGVGVPAFGGGFGGGGGGGGAAAAAAAPNALQMVAGAKGNLLGEWAVPGDGQQKQMTAALSALSAAMSEGQAMLAKARALATALQGTGVTLTVPAGM